MDRFHRIPEAGEGGECRRGRCSCRRRQPRDAFEKFRAAANLSLGELLNRGTTTVAGLVEAPGADDRALRKLLRYLEVLELETVIADAGLKFTAAEVVGWGSVLRTLGRA